MRLRSKGLGRKEMVMDFREYEVRQEGDELVIVGIIRDPVTWDFSMRFCEDDYPAILGFILRKATLKHIFQALFSIRKKHHWAGTREEHLEAGRKNRELIQPEVDARVQAALSPIDGPKRTRRSRNAAVDLDDSTGEKAA